MQFDDSLIIMIFFSVFWNIWILDATALLRTMTNALAGNYFFWTEKIVYIIICWHFFSKSKIPKCKQMSQKHKQGSKITDRFLIENRWKIL